MFSVRAVIKNKSNKFGKHPVYIRVIMNSKTSYISSGFDVLPMHWHPKKYFVKAGWSKEVNETLETMINKIKILIHKDNFATPNIKEVLKRIQPKSHDFISYCLAFIKNKEEKGLFSTTVTYIDYVNQLKGYSETIDVFEINEAWIDGFVRHLKRTNNNNTIKRKIKFFSGIMRLVQKDVNCGNPWFDYSFKASKPKIKTIPNLSDIRTMVKNLEFLKGNEQLAVSIFLTQFFTRGTRISDILHLKPSQINGDVIEFFEKKNQEYKRTGLHPIVKGIIKRYAGGHYVFPLCEYRNMNGRSEKENELERKDDISRKTALVNKYLKKACERLGIERRFSSHAARHAFTTIALEKLDGDLRLVQGLVNHKKFSTTEGYAQDLQRSDYSILENKIFDHIGIN